MLTSFFLATIGFFVVNLFANAAIARIIDGKDLIEVIKKEQYKLGIVISFAFVSKKLFYVFLTLTFAAGIANLL
jgi:hypothetical protein